VPKTGVEFRDETGSSPVRTARGGAICSPLFFMHHFVYIIYSPTWDIFYKGYTTHPSRRLLEHNSDLSRFTAGKGPWILVYLKEFLAKREALVEERRLKCLNRRSLELLIQSSGLNDISI